MDINKFGDRSLLAGALERIGFEFSVEEFSWTIQLPSVKTALESGFGAVLKAAKAQVRGIRENT